MVTAAFAKNGLRRHHYSLTSLWKTTAQQHFIPGPALRNVADHLPLPHRLLQSRSCSRPPKTKQLDFLSSRVISSALSSIRSPDFGLVSWYLSLITTRPIATKSITSACIYTAADLSSQTIAGETSEGYDWVRTLRMAGYGLIIIGSSLHYWFNFVSKMFPKRDLFSTIKKMVLGQTVYGPIVTSFFFSANAALQGETSAEIIARLKRDLLPTMLSGIMYWPVCDFVTFRFIPVHLQPLVSNSFAFVWNIYLTYMASLAKVSTT